MTDDDTTPRLSSPYSLEPDPEPPVQPEAAEPDEVTGTAGETDEAASEAEVTDADVAPEPSAPERPETTAAGDDSRRETTTDDATEGDVTEGDVTEPAAAEREPEAPEREPGPAGPAPSGDGGSAAATAVSPTAAAAAEPAKRRARTSRAEKTKDGARPGRTARAARPDRAARPRRPLVTTLRAVTGLAVVALAAGAVAAAGTLPAGPELAAAPLSVDVPPTEVALVCPAPTTGAGGGGSDAELGGASDVSSALVAGVLTRDDGLGTATLGALPDGSVTELEPGDAAAAGSLAAVETGTVLRGEPTGVAAFASAGLAQRALSGDLRGLGALACPGGGTTAWFVAGRTTVGSSTVLQLANPGSTPATVSVRAWSETGEVSIDRGEVVVAPGETIEQAIEALAPDVSRLALLVSSRGGVIAASLRTTDLDGLTAAGLDLVGATGGPGTDLVVPGVVLGSSTVDDGDPSLVRLLNPGSEPAEVVLELVGADGVHLLGGDQRFVVDPGVVAEVSLAGAPAGTYALRATSDVPIVAGVSLVRVGGPDPIDPDVPLVDRAWLGSVPLAASSVVAVPGLGSLADRAVLVLAGEDGGADGESDEDAAEAADVEVAVTAIGADGSVVGETSVTVPAGRSTAVDLTALSPATALVRLDATGGAGVSSAVVLTYADELGELISVVPATEDPQVERTVHVAVTTG